MIKKILLTCYLLTMSSVSLAAERIDLYVGEIKILDMTGIERIAVGNPTVVSNSLLNNGQFILIAESAGSSNIHVWFANGKEKDYSVRVIEQNSNLIKRKLEVEKLLGDIQGLGIDLIGDRIVVTGLIDSDHEATVTAIQEEYEEVLLNINYAVQTLIRKKLEVENLLSDVDGLNVRIVGSNIVLSGLIDKGHEEAIETVKTAFPELMDLTQKASLDKDMPDNKMVIMNTKIAEFSKSFTDELGIDWDTSVAGFAGGAAFNVEGNNVFRAAAQPATSFSSNLLPGTGNSALGYFGIASEITSRINFAVSSGNGVILAEPRLTARSGGEATFLSGGEFPIEISNINGTTVEFKQYGIQLSVKPTIDRNNNIRANVTTELSAPDFSIVVGDVPGLISRKTAADVILQAGETLVMSGLIDQQSGNNIDGIKFLSDIPIIGALFRSERFRDDKTELVIFVTPTIIDSESEINQQMIEYADEGIKNAVKAINGKNMFGQSRNRLNIVE